jgi:hypothetical protein
MRRLLPILFNVATEPSLATRALIQGMKQELLTGRIRLI